MLFSAALLVITLGIAISQLSWGPDDDQRGPAGPAIHAPATPSPDDTLADETLVEIILPADLLPADEPVNATMSTVTVPVGTFQQGPDEAIDNPGFLATYILHGTVSVVSDEPMQWIRGGGAGTTEEVEAGTEVTLRPGDAVVTRKSPGEVWTNEGPDDVRMFAMEAFGGARMTSAFPFGWVMTDTGWDAESLEGWPDDQPTILRLRRVTAPNGTVLPLPAEAIVQLARSDDGSSIGKQSDGSIRFIGGSGMGTAFVMTIEPVEEAATPAP